MRTPAAARWRRRPEARPDEILDAALDEFIAKGFDAARMEDVAKRAGISKAGVYLYFDAKEALLRALISREIAPISERAQAMAKAGADDPERALRMIAQIVLPIAFDPRRFALPRLVISISNRYPEIARHYVEQVVAPARAALETLIEAGVGRGVFRKVDPVAATRAVIGPVLFEAFWRNALGGESTQSAEEIAAYWADLLLNGLKKESAT